MHSTKGQSGRLTHRASVFTGKADFYESLYFMEDILKRARAIASVVGEAKQIPWHTQEAMSNAIGFALTPLQYRKIRAALNSLGSYLHLDQVRRFLALFSPSNLDEILASPKRENAQLMARMSNREPRLGHILAKDRTLSIGKRKTAVARVTLVPGTGECFVNGRPASEYFMRLHEMFRIADPFTVTATFGKYNAWCIVRGGGFGGQAGAIAHGIAKSISLLDEKYKCALEKRKALPLKGPLSVAEYGRASAPFLLLIRNGPGARRLSRGPLASRSARRGEGKARPAGFEEKVYLGQALAEGHALILGVRLRPRHATLAARALRAKAALRHATLQYRRSFMAVHILLE